MKMIFNSISHSIKSFDIFCISTILYFFLVKCNIKCISFFTTNLNETIKINSIDDYHLRNEIPSGNEKTKKFARENFKPCFAQSIYNSEYMVQHEQKDIVLQQYLSLPYPAVSNEVLYKEKKYYDKTITQRTIKAYGEVRKKPFREFPGMTAESINHYLYQGKNHFRSQFRTIIAGGGTDGGAPFMAEQLNHTNSEVLYLDFSKASVSIVQLKAKWRGNLKIVWVRDWIESIPCLGLGRFDFAVSTGVLHHLKSPKMGLRIVNDVQKETGGAEFMLYGKHGRTSIYQIQELIRIINNGIEDLEEEIRNAKAVLNVLPERNLFHTIEVNDHIQMGDAGIYDLVLHHRDVSYSIPEFYDWIEENGYNVVDFVHARDALKILLNIQFLEKILFDKEIEERSGKLKAITELLAGNMYQQDFYVSKLDKSEALLDTEENIIYAFGSPLGFRNVLNDENNYRHIQNNSYVLSKLGRSQVDEFLEDTKLHNPEESYWGDVVFPKSDFNRFVIESLTQKPTSARTIDSIITDYNKRTKSKLTIKEGTKQIHILFWYLKQTKIFFLKHKNVPNFPLTCCSFNMYRIFSFNESVFKTYKKGKTKVEDYVLMTSLK